MLPGEWLWCAPARVSRSGLSCEMRRDCCVGLGILTAVFHRVRANLSIRKVDRTQPDGSIHSDARPAVPVHAQSPSQPLARRERRTRAWEEGKRFLTVSEPLFTRFSLRRQCDLDCLTSRRLHRKGMREVKRASRGPRRSGCQKEALNCWLSSQNASTGSGVQPFYT